MSFGCPACRRVFTALSGFDAHQSTDYRRKDPVVCLEPATLGMAQNEYGRWYTPADAAGRARLREIRAAQPPAHIPGTPRAPEASEAL